MAKYLPLANAVLIGDLKTFTGAAAMAREHSSLYNPQKTILQLDILQYLGKEEADIKETMKLFSFH